MAKITKEEANNDPLLNEVRKREMMLERAKLNMHHAHEYLEVYGRPQSHEAIIEYVTKYARKYHFYPSIASIVSWFTPIEISEKYSKNRKEWTEDSKQLEKNLW